jgi:hypothetical protein
MSFDYSNWMFWDQFSYPELSICFFLLVTIINPDTFELWWSNAVFCVLQITLRYLMFCMNSLLLLTEIWQPSIMFCSLLLPFDYLLVVIINPDTFELWSNAVFCVLRNTFRYLMFCINSLLLLWTDVQGRRYGNRPSSSVAFSCLLIIATESFGINLVIWIWVCVSFFACNHY